jgi:Cu(I)/Ag(I) efflux system membrane protein CusA/SilA
MINKIIGYFLHNRIITFFVLAAILLGGLATAPFNWDGGIIPRDPVAVDAIPDIGDNQQIIATDWMGHSPKDIQEQVTYPLTTALMGIPGVKTIRSTSMFGMSFIYIIFKEDIEFYWSRSRILEKLNSLPNGLLPEGVKPALGPDATALGQIFWYTLEGRDPKTGKPTGGWDPQELRTLQDYYVRYQLSAAEGVSEVASVGGYVKEYQIDLDPEAMRAYGLNLVQVMLAAKNSNIDVGAGTMEINRAEYLIRGLGYVKHLKDLEEAAITSHDGVPVRIKDVAKVTFGPADRRGGLDKEGQEAVGGVVVARYGSNPMQVIDNVKKQIDAVSAGLPEKTLKDGTVSKVTVVPFYDRTQLIKETIGTLESSLTDEILICIIVVLILVLNLRASIVIATMLPLAVLATFIIMKLTGVEANIVALSGIAIAIGVMVDVGVVFMENVVRKLETPTDNLPAAVGSDEGEARNLENVILSAVSEVSGAIMTGMGTTVVSFLPVFAMQAQEGKMFHPLAFTKTFALLSALILGLLVLPTLAYWIFSLRLPRRWAMSAFRRKAPRIVKLWRHEVSLHTLLMGLIVLVAVYVLTDKWLPLGPDSGFVVNMLFVLGLVGVVIAMLWTIVIYYEQILRWCLDNRWKFMLLPLGTIVFGLIIWKRTGSEFMPTLDEGTFMLMPTAMPHSGVEENIRYSKQLDRRIKAIPEVESAVGKWGRAESALDPAPIQMYEVTINYNPEYMLDENGQRARFKTDRHGRFMLKGGGVYDPTAEFRTIPRDSLVPSANGKYFRQWRKEIRSEDDIWAQISAASELPGLTGSPKLQPIATRQVMLSTGMKAPMGLKVYGPDLAAIEKAGLQMEKALKEVKDINAASVYYDRSTGAPYIEITPDREKLGRYGIQMGTVQSVIETAIGGMAEGNTVEGRERHPIRVRYARELRNDPDVLKAILVPAADGTQIPLGQLATFDFVRGATMINSENTFLVGYITFDKMSGTDAEVDVVNHAQEHIDHLVAQHKIVLPKGVTYQFTGTYEQQIHAAKRLAIVIPIALMLILLILYFQFKSVMASLIHFSGVFVAFAGGFILIWLYGQEWFLNFDIAGVNMRSLFGMGHINLSVAVWVGFIALFGIATDDGVLMGTYIHQTFLRDRPQTREAIKEAVVKAGRKRVRPAAMTTATTLIALLPVLSSTGKGADIMVPMSIPTFGGMLIQTMTMFVVPVFQCWWRESALGKDKQRAESATAADITSS